MKKKLKLKGALKAYLQWPLFMTLLLCIMDACLYLVDKKTCLIGICFTLLYLMLALTMYLMKRPVIVRDLVRFAASYGQVQRKLLKELSIPYAVLDTEGHILWGTVTQFSLFLLLREVCFVLLGLFGLSTGFWPIYGVRVLSLLLWAALWSTGMLHWMKDQLEEGDIPLYIVVGNTFLVLLVIWSVWKNPLSRDYLWLPIIAAILALLVLVNGIVLLWDQNRIHAKME